MRPKFFSGREEFSAVFEAELTAGKKQVDPGVVADN
jgi:hypothetical protein